MTTGFQNNESLGTHPNLKCMLIVAPDQFPRLDYTEFATELKITIAQAHDLNSASRCCETHLPDFIMLPIFLHGESTLAFMLACLKRNPNIQVIVTLNRDQINQAADAMRAGVVDCLFRPFSVQRLKKTMSRVVLRLENTNGNHDKITHARRKSVSATTNVHTAKAVTTSHAVVSSPLIGQHPANINLKNAVQNAQSNSAPVLLSGEAGSGKLHCARLIHLARPFQNKHFHRIDCATISLATLPNIAFNRTGFFTHYLDEICDLTSDVQSELIRIIGENPFKNFRLIGATKYDPEIAIQDGRLHRDFYTTISANQISVPALRHQGEDLLEIARQKLRIFTLSEGGNLYDFDPQARRVLCDYSWPGNIREMLKVMRQIVVMHGKTSEARHVSPEMLPTRIKATPEIMADVVTQSDPDILKRLLNGLTLAETEKLVIKTAIETADGNITRAAKALGLAPSTLYRKLQSWGTPDKNTYMP